MDYCTVSEKATEWGISTRRVRYLINAGKIRGVIVGSNGYLIPCDAVKPADGRIKTDRKYVFDDAFQKTTVNNDNTVCINDTADDNSEKNYYCYSKDKLHNSVYYSNCVWEDGNTYKASVTGCKPLTLTESNEKLYLKWNNDVIGLIDGGYNVRFVQPNYNKTVILYTRGRKFWTKVEFGQFLEERTVSRDRRDIERILFRCGLKSFDIFEISLKTRAINSRDLLWIAKDSCERLADAMTDVFEKIFIQKIDIEGESLNSPEGYNIKRYGVVEGKYGIIKKRLNPVSCDCESEVAAYLLSKEMNVNCCPCHMIGKDEVFSEFEYDFSKEYIVHFRRLVDSRGENEYHNLITARPQFQKDIIKMIAFDFITRQDDRHLSNIAVKVLSGVNGDDCYSDTDTGSIAANRQLENFYPLYDNGRCLFYEDTEETVSRAVSDIKGFATTFGPSGTYYDYVTEIASNGTDFSRLINLDISKDTVHDILMRSGFKGYRLEGAEQWIMGCIDYLKSI